jgi:HEAT repeat protein
LDSSDDGDFESGSDESGSIRSELLAYSDLSRAAMAEFRARWAVLHDSEREILTASLAELAELSVDVNFNRVFRDLLCDENPRIRRMAITGLWEDSNPDLPGMFFELLGSDPDTDVRAAAALALQPHLEELSAATGDTKTELLAETLVSIGADPKQNSLVRRRCIESAGLLAEDRRVSQMIQEAYADDDQTLAAGALRAMGLSRQARWIPEIERALESPDSELRFEAAGAAGLLGEPQLVEGLAGLVDDEDAEVQAAAIGALGKIGGPGALRVLRRLLESGHIDDEEMIQDALDEAMLSDDPLARA